MEPNPLHQQVVREAEGRDGELVYEEAGDLSQVRTFVWLEPTPTPTATATPTATPFLTPTP